MKVYAPNKGYTGVSASVAFCNGIGETDDLHLLDWFRGHGYKVEDTEVEDTEVEDTEVEDTEVSEEEITPEPEKEKKTSGSKKAGE